MLRLAVADPMTIRPNRLARSCRFDQLVLFLLVLLEPLPYCPTHPIIQPPLEPVALLAYTLTDSS